MSNIEALRAVDFDNSTKELILLDQTRLPGEVVYLRLRDIHDIWEAIKVLRVRGAPAIGVAAGFGFYLAVADSTAGDSRSFIRQCTEAASYLESSRPTAVNLSWALQRMMRRAESLISSDVAAIKTALLDEAYAIMNEDIAMCRAIGENGLSLLKPGWGLLTHCNAGQLAASRYGTALAPMYVGAEKGFSFHIYADETRPLLQGARLTAFELQSAGLDVTLICDGMASQVMKNGWINAVLVGCDRVAANGDTANKIGTSGVAILAKHYGIPFYVLGPTSTIDHNCPDGSAIVIEQRSENEVTELWYSKRMAPAGVKVFNPAFDVTPHELVTAIITERGVHYPPFTDSLNFP